MQYESGRWDYLEGIHQISQYSLLAGYLGFLGSKTILDVGSGVGILRRRIEGVGFERYVGIDPAPAAIEQAQELADDRTEFRLGDAFLPDLGVFDAVVCNEILYCIPRPRELVDRLPELVAPGGHLLVSNMRHPGDRGLRRILEQRFASVAEVDVRSYTDRGTRARRVGVYSKR